MTKSMILAMACAATTMAGGVVFGQAAPRQMEHLGRGVVSLPKGDGKVWVGWRLLGTDPENIAFNVYRQMGNGAPQKITPEPIRNVTWMEDANANLDGARYSVRAVIDGREEAPSQALAPTVSTPARWQPPAGQHPYLSIPLKNVPQNYQANDASAADLDGDGEYEIVLHLTGAARDNSQAGRTDPPLLQAYKLDGTLLWTINLGRNIRDGAHYTQFMVYDFDGDGKAEMICKTSDGTTDGKGKVLGNANANHVNEGGHVLKGPEWLTVFEGLTGGAVDTVPYLPARTEKSPENPDLQEYRALWGDNSGNRGERYLAAVAYLDGVRPSVVMCRGYYTRSALAAYDYKNGKLTQRWLFDTGADRSSPLWKYAGEGNHNLAVADVSGDGKDDIIYGGMALDASGKPLWTTGYGHGDALHVGDLDPANPGLEMFRIQERWADAGAHMVDLKTGKTLWKKPSVSRPADGKNQGPGRGLAADIDPRHPGFESWALGAGVDALWDAKGNLIADKVPTMAMGAGQTTYGIDRPEGQAGRQAATCNFRIYWDGDTLDELLDRNQVAKWDYQNGRSVPLLVAEGCRSNNGTKATPTLSADLFGDWREEVIFPTTDGKELRIFTTTIPTEHRFYTLMHDPVYRLSIAWQNVAYNQPPHPGFYLGNGPKAAPKPNIVLVKSAP